MILETVMNAIYDWVDYIINSTVDPSPGIAIIPSHLDIPAPEGTYITIQYSPIIETFDKADWKVEEEGGTVYKTLRHDCEATVEIWETNGTGEYLYKLVNYQWVDGINDNLRTNNISVLRNNNVVTIPSIQPDDKWQRESVVEFIFGFGAGIKYEINDIDNIDATGTLQKEDGTEKTVEVTK